MSAVAAPRSRTWQDAYDLQMALWRWTRTNAEGHAWLRLNFNHEVAGMSPNLFSLLRRLYSSENYKLLGCDPIYVSQEMCEVVDAAKGGFEPEALLPTDLLTPAAFVYFEKPFVVPDRYEEPVSIHACSWAPMIAASTKELPPESDGIGWEATGLDAEGIQERLKNPRMFGDGDGGAGDGVAITLYSVPPPERRRNGWPAAVPFHLTPWWFGMSFDGNQWDETGQPTGARWWWQIVQVSMRLMQQQIAVRHNERPARQTLRAGQRAGFDEREVVVVRLRRERGEAHEPTGHDANYSHRFIVSGHWRQQWYPSAAMHRQIWISPYVKGPEDQPLVVKPRRVFAWDR